MKELPKEYTVYKHTTPNGKIYIGITRMPVLKRWANGKGYRHNDHFNRAIEKYGWDNIKHEILYEGLTKYEASDKERELIAQYGTTDYNKGYNMDYGGCFCDRKTPETRAKMSKIMKGRKGTRPSKKGLAALRKDKLEKWSRKEYREWATKRIRDGNGVRVRCVETGKEYETMGDAARDTGANQSYIGMCCRGKAKISGGFHWEFVEKNPKLRKAPSYDGKKVAQYDHEGNLIAVYRSMSEAERVTGETRPTIKRSAENRKKYNMKHKYIWKYV